MKYSRRYIEQLNSEVRRLIAATAAEGGDVRARLYDLCRRLEEDGKTELAGLLLTTFLALDQQKEPNVNFYGSIGNLNFGHQVGTINASADVIANSGEAGVQFAGAIKSLATGVEAIPDIQPAAKKEALDAIEALVKEGRSKPEERNVFVLKSALACIPTLLSSSAAGLKIWETFAPAVRAFFS